MSADFILTNLGTIFTLEPITDAAIAWVDVKISEDAVEFNGVVVIEHRYAQQIAEGIHADGLVIH